MEEALREFFFLQADQNDILRQLAEAGDQMAIGMATDVLGSGFGIRSSRRSETRDDHKTTDLFRRFIENQNKIRNLSSRILAAA